MRGETNEVVLPESNEEKLLWQDRAQLEKKIEKREKMLHNARERLNCRWVLDDFDKVEDEVRDMEEEVRNIREEMSVVDRKIRVAEREGSEEEEKVANSTKLVEEEAKAYRLALGEARQKREEMVGTISKIEARLKEMGKV
jgi:predicted  nucleic acid-binding Zn-ribbon protein